MNNLDYYKLSVDEVLKKTESSRSGLSSAECSRRLLKNGKNKIQSFKEKSAVEVFVSQFKSFLVWLLIIADIGSIYLWLRFGKQEFFFNLVVITFIIFINAFLGFFQEFQAERSAEKLEKMLKVGAKVLRDKQEIEIDASDLVIGDIILLSEGDKIPADARLIEAEQFYVDESSLTGESIPVEKAEKVLNEEKPVAERTNMIFAQTFVVRGDAKAVVVTIGMRTEVGKIFSSVNITKEQKTSFEQEIDVVGKKIAIVVGIAIIGIAGFLFYHHMALSSIFIISVSLAVGAIPEGLPAISTFVLALGSQKMLKQNFLVKKLSSIESIGSIDVIATDKTGTLTQNKMSVERVFLDSNDIDLTKDKHLTSVNREIVNNFLNTIVLANEVEVEKDNKFLGDPTETALLELAKANGLDPKKIKEESKRLDLEPFSSDTKFGVFLYHLDGENIIFVNGAPEIVIEKCAFYNIGGKDLPLTADVKKKILDKTEEFSKGALRITMIASKKTTNNKIKDIDKLSFLSLVGLKDPPRPEVKEAIFLAKSAGIKVIMITGDYKLTAQSIAKEIGLGTVAIDSAEIKNLKDTEFEKIVETTDIFSRAEPELKMRILSVLQNNGHRVAMTGDGVNDAPALRKADVSLAMGIRGTDLAKEVSQVILLDDNFSTIINGIKEGRTIFHNLRKFVNYILTANVAEVMLIFITSLFGFIPLTATQILWTNFVTDIFPAMGLGLDPPPKNIMIQKPRGSKEQVLNKRVVGLTFAIGIKKTLIMLAIFVIGLRFWNLAVAQTMTFSWLVFSHFIRILSIRVDEGINFFINKYVNIAIFTSSLLQIIILYSFLRVFFNAVPLNVSQFIIVLIFLFVLGTPASIILTKLVDHIFPDTT